MQFTNGAFWYKSKLLAITNGYGSAHFTCWDNAKQHLSQWPAEQPTARDLATMCEGGEMQARVQVKKKERSRSVVHEMGIISPPGTLWLQLHHRNFNSHLRAGLFDLNNKHKNQSSSKYNPRHGHKVRHFPSIISNMLDFQSLNNGSALGWWPSMEQCAGEQRVVYSFLMIPK